MWHTCGACCSLHALDSKLVFSPVPTLTRASSAPACLTRSIIVDDLVQSGGTLHECAKELLRNGASCVSAYVTHAIFPNRSFEKFFNDATHHPDSSSCFKHFWVTDSNPKVADQLRGHAPFEVISVDVLIRDIILDEEREENGYGGRRSRA